MLPSVVASRVARNLALGLASSIRGVFYARRADDGVQADILREHPQYTGELTMTPDGDLLRASLRTGRTLSLMDRRYPRDALKSKNPLAVEPAFGSLTGIAFPQVAYAARHELKLPKAH